jgi:hypothetical protein
MAVGGTMLCAHCYAERLGLSKLVARKGGESAIGKPTALPKPSIRPRPS